jgi:ribosome-binding protein aMBF1 (putative translation factor)
MTRHCHNCGEEWTLTGQPGRGESCMKCRADLRVCLNCAHYDPRVAQQCRERRAEPVLEKHMGNFCNILNLPAAPGRRKQPAIPVRPRPASN